MKQMVVVLAMFLAAWAQAEPMDDAIVQLQHDWEVIRYQAPAKEREARFEALAQRAHQISAEFAGHSEPLIWEGIIVSSWAGEKGGLGALRLVKKAKGLYEQAIAIDGQAMNGSAYNSLGVLYYKVPGWPLGFGDKDKAKVLLEKALTIHPQGIDPNFFYGEYLMDLGRADEAVPYLQRALNAPARPGRQIADAGRREEARALLANLKRDRP